MTKQSDIQGRPLSHVCEQCGFATYNHGFLMDHIDDGYSGHHHDGFQMALNQVADADNKRIKELQTPTTDTSSNLD